MSGKKHHSSESIIRKLRQAEVLLHGGKTIKETCRELGIADATYYKWRRDYGDMQMSQRKRLKDLERKNNRLKRAIADSYIVTCNLASKFIHGYLLLKTLIPLGMVGLSKVFILDIEHIL